MNPERRRGEPERGAGAKDNLWINDLRYGRSIGEAQGTEVAAARAVRHPAEAKCSGVQEGRTDAIDFSRSPAGAL